MCIGLIHRPCASDLLWHIDAHDHDSNLDITTFPAIDHASLDHPGTILCAATARDCWPPPGNWLWLATRQTPHWNDTPSGARILCPGKCPLARSVHLLTPSECGMAQHRPQLVWPSVAWCNALLPVQRYTDDNDDDKMLHHMIILLTYWLPDLFTTPKTTRSNDQWQDQPWRSHPAWSWGDWRNMPFRVNSTGIDRVRHQKALCLRESSVLPHM